MGNKENLISNACVVIRSVNERTKELCYNLVCRQVDPKNVFVINEYPFENALKKTFEIGIEKKSRWTFAIDADLLVLPHALRKMIERFEKYPDDVFFYQGVMLDKLSLMIRQGGIHLYKTKFLKRAQELLPEIGAELRPESFVRSRMIEEGFHFYQDASLYCLHDFEQNLFDVYRKAYLNALKRPNLVNAIIQKWNESFSDDIDFPVVLSGLIDGVISTERKLHPPQFYANLYNSFNERTGHSEKLKLDSDLINLDEYAEKKLFHFAKKLNIKDPSNLSPEFHIRSDGKGEKKIGKAIIAFKNKAGRGLIKMGKHIINQ